MAWGAEDTAVSKLPPKLQYAFTLMVDEAAEALTRRLHEEEKKVENLRGVIKFRNVEKEAEN
ncbi:MAG TPA: hypothetical protein EYP20_00910, partial [Aigarchaeota archaeon]|nr:hypothetical protein [Aigarchaeota archaeon]